MAPSTPAGVLKDMYSPTRMEPLDSDGNPIFPRRAIQPIAFLSRTLLAAEQLYWPTETEVLGFIWTKKTPHYSVDKAILLRITARLSTNPTGLAKLPYYTLT
ncbi:hypothetical protein F5Y00DRAFT_236482, partial [Daldinia vernicosa]|uniref:uncharacterized protein n=1 Tax=Daldinia vernicosa TaxID=114800 RepID=UPI002008AC95